MCYSFMERVMLEIKNNPASDYFDVCRKCAYGISLEIKNREVFEFDVIDKVEPTYSRSSKYHP